MTVVERKLICRLAEASLSSLPEHQCHNDLRRLLYFTLSLDLLQAGAATKASFAFVSYVHQLDMYIWRDVVFPWVTHTATLCCARLLHKHTCKAAMYNHSYLRRTFVRPVRKYNHPLDRYTSLSCESTKTSRSNLDLDGHGIHSPHIACTLI